MSLIAFLASTAGRWTRAGIGIALFVLAFVMGGTWGWVLGLTGVFFVAVGALDVCLLAPLFGKPVRGRAIRTRMR